jgi:hypothetical protein
MKPTLPLALLLLVAGAASAGERLQTTEATGRSPVAGDAAAARESAKADAIRGCVEKVTAGLAGDAAPGEPARLVPERIRARAVAYVRRLQVLGEAQEGDTWVTRVRCEVPLGPLEDALVAAGVAPRRSVTTRVALRVTGVPDYARLAAFKAALVAEIRGVQDVQERSIEDGRADLEVTLAGTSRSLATDLATRRIGGLAVKVRGVTETALEVELP